MKVTSSGSHFGDWKLRTDPFFEIYLNLLTTFFLLEPNDSSAYIWLTFCRIRSVFKATKSVQVNTFSNVYIPNSNWIHFQMFTFKILFLIGWMETIKISEYLVYESVECNMCNLYLTELQNRDNKIYLIWFFLKRKLSWQLLFLFSITMELEYNIYFLNTMFIFTENRVVY